MDAYLGVTAHYISSPPDRLTEWKLEQWVLGVTSFRGRHTADNQAATFMHVINCYDIRDKVCMSL
jgi:hypothetical protein